MRNAEVGITKAVSAHPRGCLQASERANKVREIYPTFFASPQFAAAENIAGYPPFSLSAFLVCPSGDMAVFITTGAPMMKGGVN